MKGHLSRLACRGRFLRASGLVLVSALTGSAAEPTPSPAAASGTVANYEQDGISYRARIFTQSGALTVSSTGRTDILVVGGGGGGSDRIYGSGSGGRGGNGGAGIVIVRYASTVASAPDNTLKPTPQPTRPPDPNSPTPLIAEPRYKVVGYKHSSASAWGVLSVDIQGQGIEARKWIVKNIGEIASSKELLLEAGKEATSGGRCKILDESFADGILTLPFEVLH